MGSNDPTSAEFASASDDADVSYPGIDEATASIGSDRPLKRTKLDDTLVEKGEEGDDLGDVKDPDPESASESARAPTPGNEHKDDSLPGNPAAASLQGMLAPGQNLFAGVPMLPGFSYPGILQIPGQPGMIAAPQLWAANPVLAQALGLNAMNFQAGQTPNVETDGSTPGSGPSALAQVSMLSQQLGQVQQSDGEITGRPPALLYLTCDDDALSEYQCLVRKQVEVFEARQEDVESNAQGRNRPIVLGQVGIRCKHCTLLPPRHRARGAIYYPAKLNGLYQAAQNMASSHLCDHCQHVPDEIRAELLKLKDRKSSAGGGKKYWADGVRVLGVFEDKDGLRFEKR